MTNISWSRFCFWYSEKIILVISRFIHCVQRKCSGKYFLRWMQYIIHVLVDFQTWRVFSGSISDVGLFSSACNVWQYNIMDKCTIYKFILEWLIIYTVVQVTRFLTKRIHYLYIECFTHVPFHNITSVHFREEFSLNICSPRWKSGIVFLFVAPQIRTHQKLLWVVDNEE